MNPINYVKFAICALLLGGAWFSGYHFEHTRFVHFQDMVRQEAEKQIAENKAKQKEQELINKGVVNGFQNQLSAVRNYYAGLQYSSSGKLPSISDPASRVNESSAYYRLAEQCSETTAQLSFLQEWINEQVGLK